MKVKRKGIIKIVVILLIVVLIAVGVGYFLKNSKAEDNSKKFSEYTVQKQDLVVTISGTGTVNSSYRQEISPEVSGTIERVYFKEGDQVKAGDLMFELDDTEMKEKIDRTKLSIEDANMSLKSSKEDIENLIVTAPISGQVTNITISEGDNINKGATICTITDTSTLIVTLPFNVNQVKKINVGDEASVYLHDYMQTVKGKVSYISKSGYAVDSGAILYNVEVMFNNPGAVIEGVKANAQINGQTSIDPAEVKFKTVRSVKAEVSGTVKSVKIRENEKIAVGETIIRLENDDLYNQVRKNEISLRDLNTQLDLQIKQRNDYKVYAFENGTIVEQDTKVGDVVEIKDIISIVADYGKMEFEISIDELDIAKVEKGIRADVTIDALSDKLFEGVVSKVANEGDSQNGVTTYSVTITINNPEDIKSGMNANAEIYIQEKEGVLAVPTEAIQKIGNRNAVYVKNTTEDTTQNKSNTEQGQNAQQDNRMARRMQQTVVSELGEDVTIKPVQLGINNDTYIEVTEGLKEGDKILIPITVTSTSQTQGQIRQTGMMPGGMMPGSTRMIGGGRTSGRDR